MTPSGVQISRTKMLRNIFIYRTKKLQDNLFKKITVGGQGENHYVSKNNDTSGNI